jgi:hypothetical protein
MQGKAGEMNPRSRVHLAQDGVRLGVPCKHAPPPPLCAVGGLLSQAVDVPVALSCATGQAGTLFVRAWFEQETPPPLGATATMQTPARCAPPLSCLP